jgi:hypothetical protein
MDVPDPDDSADKDSLSTATVSGSSRKPDAAAISPNRSPADLARSSAVTPCTDPTITNQQLTKLLKLCGLSPPPSKFMYRSRLDGHSLEYSGETIGLQQFLSFAEAYINDSALQRALGVFSLLPGKMEVFASVVGPERNVFGALTRKDNPSHIALCCLLNDQCAWLCLCLCLWLCRSGGV